VYGWLMSGLTISSAGSIFNLTDLAWQIVDTPNLDGGATGDDILLRHQTTGQVYGWLMSGVSIDSSGAIFTVSDQAWEMVH
ncbi:MAG: hypothetical protein OQK82_04200, partial [Candidatus Pacearchaeota archaeon]|nr:hypothetical protein [Candidatus Pacearchaeota archaeon]